MSKRRLFISQPFTGYDETTIQKQRETLLDTVHSILESIPRPDLDEPEVSIPKPIPVADQVKELKEEKQDVSSDK